MLNKNFVKNRDELLICLCKKTPPTGLLPFLKEPLTKSKHLDPKNFESLACLQASRYFRYLAFSYQRLKTPKFSG